MFAEIAAANTAFEVIKSAISNGRELFDVADHATKYFDSKSKIAKKANKHGNKSELESFMALEKIKQQEEHLREIMIYAGRPAMYDDWLKYQSDCKRRRQEAEKVAARKRLKRIKLMKEILVVIATVVLAVPILGVLIYFGIKNALS